MGLRARSFRQSQLLPTPDRHTQVLSHVWGVAGTGEGSWGERAGPSLGLRAQASSLQTLSPLISLALKAPLKAGHKPHTQVRFSATSPVEQNWPQIWGSLASQPEGSLLLCQTRLPVRLGGENAHSAMRRELTFGDMSRNWCATLERKALPSRLTARNAIFLLDECKSSHFYPKSLAPGYTSWPSPWAEQAERTDTGLTNMPDLRECYCGQMEHKVTCFTSRKSFVALLHWEGWACFR